MGWSSAVKANVTKAVQHAFVRPVFERPKIDWTRLVSLDFETYWDADYTLRKLSTSEYIRDPRFKAQMVGIKIGRRKTKVYPAAKVRAALKEIDWSTHALLCHNNAFDGLILSHHYGIVPKIYYCTLSMARGLHSNDIGAGLDEVAQFYGVGNKVPDVLGQTLGIRNLPSALYKACAAYCATDVDLCFSIFEMMLEDYPASELKLIDTTIRMFCDPVLKINIPRVEAELAREIKRREDLLISIVKTQPYEENLLLKTKEERALEGKERIIAIAKKIVGSSEKFAQLLRDEGVEPGTKISPAWIKKKPSEREDDKKHAYAFAKDDQFMQELLESPDDRLVELAECRIGVKSTGNVTKAQRFLNACANGWSLPVGLAYYRAHTGRWGGNNKMNMQNLVRGGELRLSIEAPKGHHIVVADSGQIECRVNGWLWGQDDLIDAFRNADAGNDRDAYCKFADLVYNRVITKADKIERHVGKTSVLGLGFQMGAEKFKNTLAKGANGGPPVFFEMDLCNKIVQTYRRKNHRIAAGWNICKGIIEDMAAGREGSYKCLSWEKETIWLPNGMALKYPDLKCSKNEDSGWDEWTYRAKEGRKKIYGGLLCENIIQALARIIVGEQMSMISEKRRIVMMTHDEVVAIAKIRAADQCFKEMMKAMTTPLPWCLDLPLNAEGGHAPNYSK